MKINLSTLDVVEGNIVDSNKLLNAIKNLALKANGEHIEIVFDDSIYYFSEEKSVQEIIFITNTVSKLEMYPPLRKVGIMLRGVKNITLNLNGAQLMYSGRMTEFVIDHCENIKIINGIIDFEHPTTSEFNINKVTPFYVDIVPHTDSPYTIKKGKFRFDSSLTGTKYSVTQECDNKGNNRRTPGKSHIKGTFLRQIYAKKLAEGVVRLYIPFSGYKNHLTYTITSALRDASGVFINKSRDTVIENCTFYYMHGMGVIAQLSHNLSIIDSNFIPNAKRGRTDATFADVIHCSMCSGLLYIKNVQADGTRDDIVNVHGNHFKVTAINGKKITLKYKHPQTYGFDAFENGDKVEFINSKSLLPIDENVVVSHKLVSPKIIELELKEEINDAAKNSKCCIENATMTMAVHIDGLVGRNIPTRGFLLTTRQKVLIENCHFIQTYMPAILISDDASGWYESGYVRDITIRNNIFENCNNYNIDIRPEHRTNKTKEPIHKNISVINNKFVMKHDKLAFVDRVDGFVFEGNIIEGNTNAKIDVKDSINVNIKK